MSTQISAPQPVRDKYGREQVWLKKFTLPAKYFIYIVGNAGARIEEIRKGTNTQINRQTEFFFLVHNLYGLDLCHHFVSETHS